MDKRKKPDSEEQETKGFRKYFDIYTTRLLIVAAFAVILLVALSHLGSLGASVSIALSICTPFVMGACIAYFVNMPMSFFERHLFAKFKRKRTLSMLLAYLVVLGVIVLLVGGIVPQLATSLSTLFSHLPGYLKNLEGFIDSTVARLKLDGAVIDTLYSSFTQGVTNLGDWLANNVPIWLRDMVSSLSSSVVSGGTAIIGSIYMLANKEKLQRQFRRVLYAFAPTKFADKAMGVAKLSNGIFSGFLGGKLLDSLVLGIICFIFMSIANVAYSFTGAALFLMPYSLLISMLIGITNIIPYFGPFMGTIPSAFILLLISPPSALVFVIFIIVLQQVDANYITPKILGRSTGLPALWVFVGTIVGGKLGGILGMLLGVPAAAVLYALASHLIAGRLEKKGLDKESMLVAEKEVT